MQSGVGKNIVVVGNGRSMLGSGLGSQINAFDEVARFNHFAIKGYEQDVGTKTTIMVMAQIKNPKDCPKDGRLQRAKRILVPFSFRHGGCVKANDPCKVSHDKKQKIVLHKKINELRRLYATVKMASKTVVTTLEEVDILYSKYKLYEKFPSSGLQVLFYMTKHFDKVYYAGFDFNTRSHDHYFETKLKNMTCHNMADEARVIQALEMEGKLVNLNPVAAAATKRLPIEELYTSITADYSPDCKIVCGVQHFLPKDTCQKWYVPPPGILPWQASFRDRPGKMPIQVDGPHVPNQCKKTASSACRGSLATRPQVPSARTAQLAKAAPRVARAAGAIAPAPAPVETGRALEPQPPTEEEEAEAQARREEEEEEVAEQPMLLMAE